MFNITYDHKIEVSSVKYDKHGFDMRKWCNLNLGQEYYRWRIERSRNGSKIFYTFIHESDAMWFALRWT